MTGDRQGLSRSFAMLGCGLVALAGIGGLWELAKAFLEGRASSPLSDAIVSAGLVVLAVAGMRAVQIRYRGGLRSVAGALVLYYAAFMLAALVEGFAKSRSATYSGLFAGAELLVLAIGWRLLRAGHARDERLMYADDGMAPPEPQPVPRRQRLVRAGFASAAALMMFVVVPALMQPAERDAVVAAIASAFILAAGYLFAPPTRRPSGGA